MTEEKYFFEREVFSRPDYEFEFESDEKVIKEILKHKKSGKVLDLGCGEGGNSLELVKKGFDVSCVDISETAINNIKKESENRGLNINAICADLEEYEIDGEYDIIIGNGFFHFLPEENALKLIEKCKEHTKVGGINIFEVLLEGDPSQEDDSEGHYFKSGKLKEIYNG